MFSISFLKKGIFGAILGIVFLSPGVVNAGFFSIINSLFEKPKSVSVTKAPVNAQTMALLQAAVNPDPNPAKGGGDITVVDGTALLSEDGPSGTELDVEQKTAAGHISLYVVRQGDSLASIAKLFGVSKNTIVWANDIANGTIKVGQQLVILPISGVEHTVVKGDTIASVAKKYKGDAKEIAQFNDLDPTGPLAVGDTIIIPDGEASIKPTTSNTSKAQGKIAYGKNPWRKSASGPDYPGYYIRPIIGGRKTQGLHGFNGIDLASVSGANVLASAAGTVIVSKNYGYNGGYGSYIVIAHDNGTETLYAHLAKNLVFAGEQVVQGEVIGLEGATGDATGVHLHFEIRGAVNPF